jgi:hypothetical protein
VFVGNSPAESVNGTNSPTGSAYLVFGGLSRLRQLSEDSISKSSFMLISCYLKV